MTARGSDREVVASTHPSEKGDAPSHTLFHAQHTDLGAHMVSFAGWEMPLYYPKTGIMAEHRAVRTGVGLFDVSHMSILTVTGRTAADFLSIRTSANATSLKPGACRYTFVLDVDGHMIDDAVVSRLDEEEHPQDFLLVSNAGMAPRIVEILLQHRMAGTEILRWNGQVGILAVQGPRSRDVIREALGWDLTPLKYYTSGFFPWGGGMRVPFRGTFGELWKKNVLVSRTGYTGELGYELFLPADFSAEAWTRLTTAGCTPAGLGARDSLRMEKGFLLSGTDFHNDRTPLEAGLDRFLSFDHPFVGKAALEKQRSTGGFEVFSGLLVEEPGAIPRHGTPLFQGDKKVGTVTSGGLSPTLNQGIALAYLPPDRRTVGSSLELEIRGRRVACEVVTPPFVT